MHFFLVVGIVGYLFSAVAIFFDFLTQILTNSS